MKVSDSFASLVQGVSQQQPQLRRPGQHGEQVNMVPDPVVGLARRHGSIWQAERNLSTDASWAACEADARNWRSFDYSSQGKEYTIVYRPGPKPLGSTLPSALVYNKTDGAWLSTNVLPGPLTALLDSGGVSAIAAVGRYVFMAGNSIVPTGTTVDSWGTTTNQNKAVMWIRGGAYSRTYTATVTKQDGSLVTFSYTTPASAYPGTLDTSGVPAYAADPAGGTTSDTEAAYITAGGGGFGYAKLGWASWAPTSLVVKDGTTTLTNVSPADPTSAGQYRWDGGADRVKFHPSLIGENDVTMTYTHTKTVANPNYARIVNDLTSAYNTAVTQWIATAAAAIQPHAIAQKLLEAAQAAGFATAQRINSTVTFDNVVAIAASDGGDGTLVRGVANTITSVDEVSTVHFPNKVVKVQIPDSAESFYLRAVPKNAGASGATEVTWVEGAGQTQSITAAWCYGTVEAGSFHITNSATDLLSVATGPHPDFVASTAGDSESSPMPFFVGKQITFMGVFQDRLLVGAKGVLSLSQIGEYLNFFRGSALTLAGDDAFSVQAEGSEDDDLRFGVNYDQNLVIFGREQQYVVPGRGAVTALSTGITIMSQHVGAADSPPVAAGSLIFYAKRGQTSTSVHQIQPGQIADSPESFLASSQLTTYIPPNVVEAMTVAKPTALVVRSASAPSKLYLFHYLDLQDGRRQDAWHRWEFAPELGTIMGMSQQQDNFLLYMLRRANGRIYAVADSCSMVAETSTNPYLDSQRPYSTVLAGTTSLTVSTPGDWKVAFDDSSDWRLFGDALANASTLIAQYPAATGLRAGAAMRASFEPTNPFVFDSKGKAILSGRLTVTKYAVSYSDSSGFVATVTAPSGAVVGQYNARITGNVGNLIGRTVVTDGSFTVPIGREAREYTARIESIDWLPLTLTDIEWTGQLFNRARRI